MLQRVLIANRGEIAVRIARAAAALGMESVAVYANADAAALHPRLATCAREIGAAGSDPVAPYLDIEALIAAATASGCDCVHPGYGFLAENPAFAAACKTGGLAFIGPGAETLALFGDKVRARALAVSLGVSVAPGSDGAVGSAEEAVAEADTLGWPVMLKAAGGGGGRGLRAVANAADMAGAFARCASEARAAFGDGAVFVEKLIERPRHIEVQVLADRAGDVVCVGERDCSVQLRHQKLVEIAPAPNLDPKLREGLFADARALARAGAVTGAATFEFLIDPKGGERFFVEANPRIQVEHTVTEETTGIDLVEAQFRFAAGEALAALGLGAEAPAQRGFAVQARVAAAGPGRIGAYREPGGPGVRVDSCGFSGWAPPSAYDPMFAKVIGRSGASGSLAEALDRTARALAEFDIEGLPTNLASLRAILAHPAVRAGDARTTLLGDCPELLSPAAEAGPSAPDAAAPAPARTSMVEAALALAEGEIAVRCPVAGAVLEVAIGPGALVAEGETLMVVSAMKMETEVAAPCAGRIARLARLAPGTEVAAGAVVAAIEPAEAPAARSAADNSWEPLLAEVEALRAIAHRRFAPDSTDPGVVRQRSRGKLTCRERIDLVLDAGSFREVGSLAGFASWDEEGRVADFTPANHVGGWGTIAGRTAVVCADDFTSRGGHADGAVGAKSGYLDRLALELRCPSLRLLDGSSGGGSVAAMVPQQSRPGESAAKESAGAITAGRPRVTGGGGSFLPGHLGSSMYAEELARVPVVNLLLGSVVGIGAAKAVLGHFSVMVRDIAQLFVAGPPVVSHAMGYDISKEDLGDWRVHCLNGSVDNLADSESEAAEQARRFLSYLPASVWEAPPVDGCDDPSDRREEALLSIVPRKRTATFDVRRAIALMADAGSFFEIGPLWGTDQVTGLARFAGHPVGVIASDSRHPNGGALTADGCDKLTRHLDLCDLFHLPILNLVDNPGFAVGLEHERAGTIRKGGGWMIAFAQTRTPIFTVIMRRSFGVAGNNYATPRSAVGTRVVWPAADVGGIPPEGGIEAAYKRQLAEAADPAALRAEINARIESARGPIGPLNRFQMEEMIDPRDTRPLVCEWVHNAWRILCQPDRLGPRALGFRP
ncbi:MAG TPA: carboxyl transferase domain-containing protein [Caulobacteraceae bacterium]|nr:carboxyl transferase domain-containing protein [Caulobacteraceae bacterium]